MIRLRREEGLDEGVDIAVHDRLHVARLHACAHVLDHRVGLKYVGADLAAPLDLLLISFELLDLSFLLLLLKFKELGAQHLQALLAVLQLRALVLALHDDARWHVRHAHGGRRLIDVLTACTRSAVGVDAHVRHVDCDLDGIVDLGHDVAGRKRRMTTRIGIERRDAHEAMHALFRLQIPVGVVPIDEECRTLDTRLIAGQQICRDDGKAVALRPPAVHAQKHLRPVLRLRAARARSHHKGRIRGLRAPVRARRS